MSNKSQLKVRLLEAEITQAEINLQDLLEVKVSECERKGFPKLKRIFKKMKNINRK
jgi:hypothetical protein